MGRRQPYPGAGHAPRGGSRWRLPPRRRGTRPGEGVISDSPSRPRTTVSFSTVSPISWSSRRRTISTTGMPRTPSRSGAHVLCEKPLTLDPGEAWDLVERARRRGSASSRLQSLSVHAAHRRVARSDPLGRGSRNDRERSLFLRVGDTERLLGRQGIGEVEDDLLPLLTARPGRIPRKAAVLPMVSFRMLFR